MQREVQCRRRERIVAGIEHEEAMRQTCDLVGIW
jgi:hypothetical protein